jgi:DNA mismatch endonuclease, patch repair protein
VGITRFRGFERGLIGWQYLRMDIVSAQTRSRMMAGIGPRNTRPELLVRRLLFAAGFRYRLHRRDLPGAPDIVLPRHRLAIFVHGCFWHQHPGCPLAKMPASNRAFWKDKLDRNQQRDCRNIEKLRSLGWRVLVIWECATRVPALAAALERNLIAVIEGTQEQATLPAEPLQTSSSCAGSAIARRSR